MGPTEFTNNIYMFSCVCACGGIGVVASLCAQQKIEEEEVLTLSLSIPNPIGRTIAAHPII